MVPRFLVQEPILCHEYKVIQLKSSPVKSDIPRIHSDTSLKIITLLIICYSKQNIIVISRKMINSFHEKKKKTHENTS